MNFFLITIFLIMNLQIMYSSEGQLKFERQLYTVKKRISFKGEKKQVYDFYKGNGLIAAVAFTSKKDLLEKTKFFERLVKSGFSGKKINFAAHMWAVEQFRIKRKI